MIGGTFLVPRRRGGKKGEALRAHGEEKREWCFNHLGKN